MSEERKIMVPVTLSPEAYNWIITCWPYGVPKENPPYPREGGESIAYFFEEKSTIWREKQKINVGVNLLPEAWDWLFRMPGGESVAEKAEAVIERAFLNEGR